MSQMKTILIHAGRASSYACACELKRNSGTQVGYQPAYAEQQAKSRHYLPRGKSKRVWRGHKGGSPVDHTQDRVPIDRAQPIFTSDDNPVIERRT